VIELNPKNAHAYTNRGNAYGSKGDNDRAIADYHRALQLDPSIEESKEGLSRLGASP
jgi:tetratricopeptide (TPR) repeat protein